MSMTAGYGRRTARMLVAAMVACTVAAAPGTARAGSEDDEVVPVKLRFAERRGKLVVRELGLGPLLFDSPAYGKLKENPLATTLVVRLYVYRQGEDQPLAYGLVTARIVYDLWLGEYEVRVDSTKGRDSGRFGRLDRAYKMMTEIADLPIAGLDGVAIGPHHYLAMVAELNPVSAETLAEMRRWLSRPAGSAALDRGTSFLGSFVSVFVNAKLPEADRVVRARSQPFYRVGH